MADSFTSMRSMNATMPSNGVLRYPYIPQGVGITDRGTHVTDNSVPNISVLELASLPGECFMSYSNIYSH